jgi:hypothetical protein
MTWSEPKPARWAARSISLADHTQPRRRLASARTDRRRDDQPPPRVFDPAIVNPGELLDLETDAQKMLRQIGKPAGPFIACEGRYFYPRRNGGPQHRPLSIELARARVLCKGA